MSGTLKKQKSINIKRLMQMLYALCITTWSKFYGTLFLTLLN